MSIYRLQQKIDAMGNPTVAGLDPTTAIVPPYLLAEHIAVNGETAKAAASAFFEFNKGLIDALCDIVPAVKPQAAFYEALGIEGMIALRDTMEYASARGMYVLLDAKRGDIGSTASAYADAYLGSTMVGTTEITPYTADALTVNGYLGSDGIRPFVDNCVKNDRAIFVLVKTSNPSSGELQDLYTGERRIYETMGELLESLSAQTIDANGYTCAGAVVGATYPEELHALREKLSHTFFLVPGYGAQGGGAADIVGAFDANGRGAIINSSRGIIAAWKKTGNDGRDYAEAARAEAIRMREDIAGEVRKRY